MWFCTNLYPVGAESPVTTGPPSATGKLPRDEMEGDDNHEDRRSCGRDSVLETRSVPTASSSSSRISFSFPSPKTLTRTPRRLFQCRKCWSGGQRLHQDQGYGIQGLGSLQILQAVFEDIHGNDVKLSENSGKVLLIVNVASKCGLT